MQYFKSPRFSTVVLITIFACVFVFLDNFALASAMNCSDLFTEKKSEKYHELVKLIDPKKTLGLGIKAIGLYKTDSNPYPLIKLQIQIESADWDKPDVAGNYFWPQNLLKSKAANFGFVYGQLANPTLQAAENKSSLGYTTFPTVEYANSAIELFNQKNPHSKNWIPFKLQSASGIVTPARYLKYLEDGLIPVAMDSGRTFIHDMNYHYLSLIVLKPAISVSNQNRAKLGLNFLEFVQETYPKERFERYLGMKLISVITAHIDQTGNFIPFIASLKADETPHSDQMFFAKILIKAIRSGSDQDFFKELAVVVPLVVPKWSGFYSKNNLLSRSEIDSIQEDFPFDHTNNLGSMQVYTRATMEKLVSQYFANSHSFRFQLPKVNKTMQEVLDILNLVAEGKQINQDQISTFKNLSIVD